MVLLGLWTAVKSKDAYTRTPEFKYRNAAKQTTSARNSVEEIWCTTQDIGLTMVPGRMDCCAQSLCNIIKTPDSIYTRRPHTIRFDRTIVKLILCSACVCLRRKNERVIRQPYLEVTCSISKTNKKMEANATINTQWEIQGCEFQRRTFNYWASWNHVTLIQPSSSPITSAPLLHGNEEEVHFDPTVRQFVV